MQHEMELMLAIKEILASLPHNEQTAVILRAQGYTQREIGAQLGVDHSTICRMFQNMRTKHRDSCVTVYEDKWNVNAYADNE